jgi:hypothetical protein
MPGPSIRYRRGLLTWQISLRQSNLVCTSLVQVGDTA